MSAGEAQALGALEKAELQQQQLTSLERQAMDPRSAPSDRLSASAAANSMRSRLRKDKRKRRSRDRRRRRRSSSRSSSSGSGGQVFGEAPSRRSGRSLVMKMHEETPGTLYDGAVTELAKMLGAREWTANPESANNGSLL